MGSGRKSYHHGDLRRGLLDAALEVLQERGPSGLSLREVARRAGVSHGAPAHHFRDKAGLLTALAVEGFELFHAGLVRAAEPVEEPVAAFAATGRAYVHFAAEHGAHFELMFRPEHLDPAAPELALAMERAYGQLFERVLAAQAAGYAARLPAEDVALSAWACVHGLATLWLNGNLQARFEGPLDEVIDRVLLASAAGLM
ncbi:MAG: TetR/AcrR family transcriptional regulator [Myxococcales bacterium]|nr:TetR/AcrR family transcriptional regulator [Myxococcales bacterium]